MKCARAFIALAAAAFLGCSVLLPSELPSTREALFDSVWREFDEHYASFAFKNVDWNILREQYRPRVVSAATDDLAAAALGDMLAELRDVHVNLYTPGKTFGYLGHLDRPYFFDASLVFNTYVPGSTISPSKNMRWGRISPSIGLIWIPGFGGNGWHNEIDGALDALEGVTHLILDIRNNGGGSSQTALAIAGRFADQRRLAAFDKFRNGPRHDDFTDFYPRYVEPAGARRFTGAVWLLTSLRNFSAAEDFILLMRAIPQVTVVGDTSGAGAGYPLYRELPNGWSYRLTESLIYDEEKQLVEPAGIAPDVFVRFTAADTLARVDVVLERACGLAGLARCGRGP